MARAAGRGRRLAGAGRTRPAALRRTDDRDDDPRGPFLARIGGWASRRRDGCGARLRSHRARARDATYFRDESAGVQADVLGALGRDRTGGASARRHGRGRSRQRRDEGRPSCAETRPGGSGGGSGSAGADLQRAFSDREFTVGDAGVPAESESRGRSRRHGRQFARAGACARARRAWRTGASVPAGPGTGVARAPRATSEHSRLADLRDPEPAVRPLPGPRPDEAAPLEEPLSESELRVLRYLPTNLRAQEIGAELFVSLNRGSVLPDCFAGRWSRLSSRGGERRRGARTRRRPRATMPIGHPGCCLDRRRERALLCLPPVVEGLSWISPSRRW
jgi:hypothetical protein